MKLYERDYLLGPNEIEKNQFYEILEKEKDIMGSEFGVRKNLWSKYPLAIQNYLTLFPNNYYKLSRIDKKHAKSLNSQFKEMVHEKSTKERDISRFINKTPAFHIIQSIMLYHPFGHHETYIFPEFSIGNGKFFADYLLVGKSSGGYHFVFVELEAVNGRTTIKSGYDGENTRAGYIQIRDWKYEIESNYSSLTEEFKKYMKKGNDKLLDDYQKHARLTIKDIPEEFIRYDSSRFFYYVITGLRSDYNDVTYRENRKTLKEQGINKIHYDNLCEWSDIIISK